MSLRTTPWPPGVPCWTDLATPDVPTAVAFYEPVIGWTFSDPEEGYGGYVTAQMRGVPAAGVGPMQPGAVSAWTMYFASEDADKTATAVADNGGSVVLPPGDVGPLGRMFIAADPTGAVFGVWEARIHLGAGIVNEPGGLVWEDLRTDDPDRARAFYRGVFGFRTDALEAAGADYTTFSLAGEDAQRGGMGGMMGNDGAPPHWLVYFGVADADASVDAAVAGGGAVLVPPFDTPFGRMAFLLDPGGAGFAIVETDGSRDQS